MAESSTLKSRKYGELSRYTRKSLDSTERLRSRSKNLRTKSDINHGKKCYCCHQSDCVDFKAALPHMKPSVACQSCHHQFFGATCFKNHTTYQTKDRKKSWSNQERKQVSHQVKMKGVWSFVDPLQLSKKPGIACRANTGWTFLSTNVTFRICMSWTSANRNSNSTNERDTPSKWHVEG